MSTQTSYGHREPQWLLERPEEHHSHFDQRGCVLQIKSSRPPRPPTRHVENDVTSATADHQTITYSTAPSVTHRSESNTTFSNAPIVEFMVPLCCGKCEEKVKEQLENDEEVYKVVCDLHNQRVTVSSSRDPSWLLQRIKRTKKNSHFWRGSTHFKGARYVTTRGHVPHPKNSHHHHDHSQELSQQTEISGYQDSATPPQHYPKPSHHHHGQEQAQHTSNIPTGHPNSTSHPQHYRKPTHHHSREQARHSDHSPVHRDSVHPPLHHSCALSQSHRDTTAQLGFSYADEYDMRRPRFVPGYGHGDENYFYSSPGDAEYHYKRSSPYKTSYNAHMMYAAEAAPWSTVSARHGHFPSSDGEPYATHDYELQMTGYY